MRFWTTTPLRRFAEVGFQHWPPMLASGLLLAWMHSLPLDGPLMRELGGAPPKTVPALVAFLLAAALGLVAAGILGHQRRRLLPFFPLGLLPCLLITLGLGWVPLAVWPILFVILGLSLGPALISVALFVANSTATDNRGRVLGLSIALFGVLLYLVTVASQWVAAAFLQMALAAFLVAALYLLNRFWHPLEATQSAAIVPERTDIPGVFSLWPLFLFIFGVTLPMGLMYSVVFPSFSERSPLQLYYGVLPVVVVACAAGFIADAKGRRVVAYAGALSLGVGFISFGLLTGLFRHFVVDTLLMAGLASIMVFIWTALADAARGRRTALYYGLGLGVNVLAVLLGAVLGGDVIGFTKGYGVETAEIAGLSLFLTLALVPAIKESLRSPEVSETPEVSESVMERFRRGGLSRRELEVASLLIGGASTKEIEGRLVIAPDTLKTHLRHIYRKMRVKNRQELTLAMVGELNQVIDGLETRLQKGVERPNDQKGENPAAEAEQYPDLRPYPRIGTGE